MSDRREFLKFLAGSPLLLAYPTLLEAFTQAPTDQAAAATLASAADALDVFDFEAMARKILPPAHWGYMASGVDGDETIKANPRRIHPLSACARADSSTSAESICRWSCLERSSTRRGSSCARSAARKHSIRKASWRRPGRAAGARGHLQILSTQSSSAIEDVAKARGGPGVWYQLYTTDSFDVTTKLLKRAEGGRLPRCRDHRGPSSGAKFRDGDADSSGWIRAPVRIANRGRRPGGNGQTITTKPMFAGIDTGDCW